MVGAKKVEAIKQIPTSAQPASALVAAPATQSLATQSPTTRCSDIQSQKVL